MRLTRWLVGGFVLLAVVVGAFYEGGRRADESAIRKVENARLGGIAQGRAEGSKAQAADRVAVGTLKREIAAHRAETARLRGVAGEYAKEVAAARVAGRKLEDTGTPDEIMAALTARGYSPVRCRAVPVVR